MKIHFRILLISATALLLLAGFAMKRDNDRMQDALASAGSTP